MNNAIEIVTFKLLPSATSEQLLATSEAMAAFLNNQKGFLYRSLSHDENNLWFDIIYWQTPACAKAGGEAFMKSDICGTMMPLLDQQSCKVRHMDALSDVLAKQLAA